MLLNSSDGREKVVGMITMRRLTPRLPRRPPGAAAAAVWLAFFAAAATSLAGAQPVTDPSDVRVVNSIFRAWKISASQSIIKWNTSGDICSGPPVTAVPKFDSDEFNPAITCDCGFDGGTTCHVTRLKAFKLNIVGRIPEELQHLTYLNNLQIGRNYLTGPLPAFIGNFTTMQYLNIAFNSLSGPIPKEIGNLQNLLSLGIGINNFTGPLPAELGNLTSLEQMYVDSLGVTGEFPTTIANLKRLQILSAVGTDFSGKLPEQLGDMISLESLRFQGNSFQGPIPSSYSKLTRLRELRICDLSSGGSSLEFLRNMKSLNTLVLRNSKISDTLSLNFGEYSALSYLDLSFNNLTGKLPESLFSQSSLTTLYLGNNSLSGIIPVKKNDSLLNIDLSYNDLSGNLPHWVGQNKLNLNLVANNFNLDKSNRGLSCLQKTIPCYRDSPVYYSFAINCGGVNLEAGGSVYEADNQNLSAASYYITDTKRWAVSSVGTFLESANPQYMEYTSSNFTTSSDPELFRSRRLSPSSLRYYGLALENGLYTVMLQFAETAFPDNSTWMSLGRRVFDIYVQGNLVDKDFDIRREAGGRSFTEVRRNYTAQVSRNFLEIHLFWAGKGTQPVPKDGYYGTAISAINVTPNFKPTVNNRLPATLSKKNKVIIGVVSAIAVILCSLLLFGIYIRWRRRKLAYLGEEIELLGLTNMPNSFSYGELKTATDDFNPANKLGEGGFGSVFKGKLPDGRTAAVKQLSVASLQGKRQFVTEVATISAVQHMNLVKLYGCCYEGNNRLLVYEFLENNSLDHALFGKGSLQLDWATRFAICLGTARGMAYLHEESSVRIVHRDIKASNILLDSNFNPKISDFGLAKLYDQKKTHISTRVAGTVGYLAPEYALRGHLTEKADVYGFGILTLEILSGRPNTGSVSTLEGEKIYLLDWAWLLHDHNCDLNILDTKLTSFNEEEAIRMIAVAFLCTQANPTDRPSMSRVVAMLLGDGEITNIPTKPIYLTEWRYDEEASFTIDSLTAGSSELLPRNAEVTGPWQHSPLLADSQ